MIEMKDSGISFIGMIPSDWNVTRNKNVFSCTKELVGTASSETQLLSLTTKGIKEKDINNPEGKLPESFDTYQFVKKNDMVMCLFDLDVSAVFSGLSPYDGMISPAYRVLHCKNNIIPKFADYWFRYISDGRKFNHYAKNIRYTLNYEDFSTLPIVQPPIDRQCRIADYLDEKCSKIDAIIEKQQAVIENLKAYKLSVITEVVTKGLNPNAEMKDSEIDWIGEIPVHWNLCKLKYVTEIMRGKFNHRPRNDPKYYDGKYPFVQTGDVARASKFIETYSQTLNELGYSVSKEFPKGSICMTIAANVGDVAVLNFDACFPDSVVGFVPVEEIHWNYLYYVLSAMKQQFTRNAIISTQRNLNVEIIKEEFIPIVAYQEQLDIAQYLDNKCSAIENSILRKKDIIEKLTAYKKSLIFEVVTGKKEV
jgi:type I restriction modification DNA specificity domain protein